MPRQRPNSIAALVSQFVEQLTASIHSDALDRAREAVLAAVGAPVRRGPGRPPGTGRGPGRPPGRARRKPPIQYCPVPGCKNRAAPVFGMVCSDHKGLPKAQIKKFRAARRAEKDDRKDSAKHKKGKSGNKAGK
jgi:hypothetical protein